MKVLIDCNSILLQKSLEIFLCDNISKETRDYDFVVSDKLIETTKPLFLISNTKNSNISKPFSKNKLQKELNEFYQNSVLDGNRDLKLKKEIEKLTSEFVENLMLKIKGHYNA